MMENEIIDKMFHLFATNNTGLEVRPPSERKELVFPDDDADFHSYRILLLLKCCGIVKLEISECELIYGRTKFSFYDFLIRYPLYLRKIIDIKGSKQKKVDLLKKLNLTAYEKAIEFSSMINYIRGPWDHNYYNIFAYMTSKQLIEVTYKRVTESGPRQFCLNLTKSGAAIADEIVNIEIEWAARMNIINEIFREDASNKGIEKFIQEHFPELTIGV